jgi:hypothetical protein
MCLWAYCAPVMFAEWLHHMLHHIRCSGALHCRFQPAARAAVATVRKQHPRCSINPAAPVPPCNTPRRVLFGKMHVKSYDWAAPASEGEGCGCEGGSSGGSAAGSDEESMAAAPPREARRVLNRVFSALDEPAVLFPSSGGNIHQFTAVTDCAVLDLLSPPYSTDEGERVWTQGNMPHKFKLSEPLPRRLGLCLGPRWVAWTLVG